jgi:phosphoglycerate dehydrogenase-like enzyme
MPFNGAMIWEAQPHMKALLFSPHNSEEEFRAAFRAFPQVELAVAREAKDIPATLPGAELLIVANRVYDAQAAELIRSHGAALKWIQFTTSGIDKAVANGMPKGVIVTNLAGLRAFAVAEHALYLMLALARNARRSMDAFSKTDWARDDLSAGMDNLAGRHLVIVGVGAIGQDIARKAKAFDMRITGISRSAEKPGNFDAILPRSELRAAARKADYLMVAALADETTQEIISRDVIAALPKRAFVVNIARGSLIDEEALCDALEQGRIAGAGLDVQAIEPLPADHRLWRLDNVVLTPHTAGAGSQGTGATHASLVAENIARWLKGEKFEKIVIERT